MRSISADEQCDIIKCMNRMFNIGNFDKICVLIKEMNKINIDFNSLVRQCSMDSINQGITEAYTREGVHTTFIDFIKLCDTKTSVMIYTELSPDNIDSLTFDDEDDELSDYIISKLLTRYSS